MEILKVENLVKKYGKENTKIVALDNYSFNIETGEFVDIVGACGSSKSTILHFISGVNCSIHSKVFINDEDIYNMNATDHIIKLENSHIVKRLLVGE